MIRQVRECVETLGTELCLRHVLGKRMTVSLLDSCFKTSRKLCRAFLVLAKYLLRQFLKPWNLAQSVLLRDGFGRGEWAKERR